MDRAHYLFEKIVAEGKNAIDEFIDTAASEELFLDFKCSSDRGENKKLSKEDLNNFGIAISGFGNSQGGIIIWGVKCSKKDDGADVAHTKIPIHNPERFLSWLEGNISNRTLPAHPSVRNHVIKTSQENGYIISLIPKSDYAPHQEITTNQYYMRSGSSFMKVPHDILAGLFGRRPSPNIGHDFLIMPIKYEGDHPIIEIGLMLSNKGKGIANNIFLNADIFSAPDELAFQWLNTQDWKSRFVLGMCHHGIVSNDVKLPPGARTCAISLRMVLIPPFRKDLDIRISYGAEGDHIHFIELKFAKETMLENYEYLKEKKSSINDEDRAKIINLIFGIKTKDSLI